MATTINFIVSTTKDTTYIIKDNTNVQQNTTVLPLCTDGDIAGEWDFDSNNWIPSGCVYNTLYDKKDTLFAQCLVAKNISNVVFYGDSVLRKIMERLASKTKKTLWTKKYDVQNYSLHEINYNNHTIYFQYIEWHYVNEENSSNGTETILFEHIVNEIKPDVLLLNAGLWDLRKGKEFDIKGGAEDKYHIPFAVGYYKLEQYFQQLNEMRDEHILRTIIWKTISAVFPEWGNIKRREPLSELRQMNMNIFATKQAKKNGFYILNDYIVGKMRPDDYCCVNKYYENVWHDNGDPIHYEPNSYTMETVIAIFKHLICL